MVALREADCAKAKVINWQALHAFSIEWYKQQGIDFTGLNKKLQEKLKG